MPYIKIWLHCVWNTKRRQPLLSKEIRQRIFNHIKDYSREKKIFIDRINGSSEHVHCLISLGSEQNISKVINSRYPQSLPSLSARLFAELF